MQPFSIAALLVDAGAALRVPGRADPEAAARDRDARGADPDPGLLQLGARVPAQPRLGVAHCVAGPSALIGASNFFELAVAAAISLFGFDSGRGARHRGRRADRGAGDAVGRGDRQPYQTLVRRSASVGLSTSRGGDPTSDCSVSDGQERPVSADQQTVSTAGLQRIKAPRPRTPWPAARGRPSRPRP